MAAYQYHIFSDGTACKASRMRDMCTESPRSKPNENALHEGIQHDIIDV